MRLILLAAASLALVAASTPSVINGVDLTQDVHALGTEPFWSVEISAASVTFSGADFPARSGPNNGPTISGGQAVWTTIVEGGKRLTVTLTAGPCSDGMSDREYPLTARVTLTGLQPMDGCALSEADLRRTAGAAAR